MYNNNNNYYYYHHRRPPSYTVVCVYDRSSTANQIKKYIHIYIHFIVCTEKNVFFFFSSGPRLGSLTPGRNENGQYYALDDLLRPVLSLRSGAELITISQ